MFAYAPYPKLFARSCRALEQDGDASEPRRSETAEHPGADVETICPPAPLDMRGRLAALRLNAA